MLMHVFGIALSCAVLCHDGIDTRIPFRHQLGEVGSWEESLQTDQPFGNPCMTGVSPSGCAAVCRGAESRQHCLSHAPEVSEASCASKTLSSCNNLCEDIPGRRILSSCAAAICTVMHVACMP